MSSGNKSRVFVLLPYFSIVLLLVGVEVALRLWASSLDDPIVVEKKYDNVEWYQINRGYLKKYFSAGTPLVPEFKESLFRKRKKDNTYRVFCLGESSMFGTPYQMTMNIPGLLRRQLRNAYPDRDIEVVNWGASAINSNQILDLSKTIAQFKPDLICVYMGHNEFYGPEGIGANWLERTLPSLIPIKYAIREVRIVKVLSSWLFNKEAAAPDENLMRQVSEGSKVPLESDDAAWVFNNYERNLVKLIEFWRRQNVRVVISDVSSNMMFPPFISDELPAGVEHNVTRLIDAGKYEEAKSFLERLDLQYPVNASINYWLGVVKNKLLYWQAARINLAIARDNDLLKFRAPLKINLIIRDVCKREQVPFVSTDSLFATLSPNDIPGEQLFWEHLHPNAAGYYAISRLFFTEIVRKRFISQTDTVGAKPVLTFRNDELGICWLDLAYGDLSIQHLTSRWPFQNYERQPAVLDSADQVLKDIARSVYKRDMVWDEGCYKTAEHFWRVGNVAEAQTTYEALLDEYPTNFYAHYLLGNLLAKTGDPERGLYHLNQSVIAKDDYPNSRLDAGLLLVNVGEFDGAIRILRGALPLTEKADQKNLRANVLYGIGAAFANKENYDEALKNLDEALSLNPRYADAEKLKAGILQHVKQ